MSLGFAGWDRRTRELALDEVAFGLAPEDRRELDARVSERELLELELAVAELSVAALPEREPPPAALRERIAADARAWLATEAPAGSARAARPARKRAASWAAAGWLAAAAALALFALDRVRTRPAEPLARRAELVAQAGDLLQAPWKPTDDPLAGGVSGDVVWSSARQEGYLRLRSLPPNDPSKSQYQLWIFDPTRADWEAKPVDGGVFDVGPGAESIVPIVAKLEVRRAALFAVTLEAPGGVVVSAREHLLATATP